MRDSTVMWGEIVGAEFAPDDVTDGRIVVRVAVDAEYSVGHRRVAIVDADDYERSLPTAAGVRGTLAPAPGEPA